MKPARQRFKGYQPDDSQDGDPFSGGLLLGGTPYNFLGNWRYGYSVVYAELVREKAFGAGIYIDLNNPNYVAALVKAYKDLLMGTIAHEIGHAPGIFDENSNHAEEGLLQEGGATIGVDFKPVTIKRFRDRTNW